MSIFVSHSFDEKHHFDNVRHALVREGVDVWQPKTIAGLPLADQLRQAVCECEACVFIATPKSLQSVWCHAEVGGFWAHGKRVILFRPDRGIAKATIPPQLVGHVWTETLADVCIAALAARDATASQWPPREPVAGLRLFQYPGLYPVDLAAGSNQPSLNGTIFASAIDFLLNQRYDRLAAMDLVYLRQDNSGHMPDVVPDSYLSRYAQLVDRYRLTGFIRDFVAEKERVFRNYKRLVYDIGTTLEDVWLEILLHDVRNPIRSIVAARNSQRVSGRREGDSSTRFVVQYVRDQGRHLIAAMDGGGKVAYRKQFARTKKVKATTTPLYDDRYGLVGILCLNIDVETVERLDAEARAEFFENYVRNTGCTPQFELDQ